MRMRTRMRTYVAFAYAFLINSPETLYAYIVDAYEEKARIIRQFRDTLSVIKMILKVKLV